MKMRRLNIQQLILVLTKTFSQWKIIVVTIHLPTLESGIDVPSEINVALEYLPKTINVPTPLPLSNERTSF